MENKIVSIPFSSSGLGFGDNEYACSVLKHYPHSQEHTFFYTDDKDLVSKSLRDEYAVAGYFLKPATKPLRERLAHLPNCDEIIVSLTFPKTQ